MHALLNFWRQRWVELLVAGVWLQSVVAAALAQDWRLLAITGLGGLLLLLVVFWLIEKLQKKRAAPRGVGEAFRVPRRALILTVGGQKDTAVFAIESQTPEWLGLLCSRQTEAMATTIIAASQFRPECVQKEIADPWDIVDVRDKMATLLRWATRQSVARNEMAVDITGGTTPMSLGVFTVAEEWGIDTQYVRSQYDAANRPMVQTQEGILVSRHSEPD